MHRFGGATVERWYQSFVKQRVSELIGRHCPQVLDIDEHFFSHDRGYATAFVDMKSWLMPLVWPSSRISRRGTVVGIS